MSPCGPGGPDRGGGWSSAGFPLGDAVRGGGCALAGAETAPGGAPGGPGFGAPVGAGGFGPPASRTWMRTSPDWGAISRATATVPPGWPDWLCVIALLTSSEMTSLASCTCGWSSPSAWLTSARASRGGLRRSGQLGVHAGTRGSARGHGVAFAVWAAVTRVLARPPGRGDGPGDLAVAEPGPGGRGGEGVEAAGLPGFDGPARGPEQPGVAVALA